ncbi:MAG: 30S ribosome-binding factor RbfA [Chloroflexota bacterium]
MSARRQRQVASILRRELSDIIQQEMKDPRLGFVSITRVEVSPDAGHARVFVSIFGSEEDRTAGIEALEGAKGFIRHQLAPKIKLRTIPRLSFVLDHSLEHAENISRLLDELDTSDDDDEESQLDQRSSAGGTSY